MLAASKRGDLKEIQPLLQQKDIDPNEKEIHSGSTPLLFACFHCHFEIVQLLLNDDRVDPNITNQIGRTPFWWACRKGDIDIVKFMIDHPKVDINKEDNNGWTPLIASCSTCLSC